MMIFLIVFFSTVMVYVPAFFICKFILLPLYDKAMAKLNAYIDKVAPPPPCAVKQQEVYDFYMKILTTNQNTRGEYWFHVQAENHCSQAEAMLIMLEHDCEDAGIQMNYDYAASLTGYAFELEARQSSANFLKQNGR